MSKKNYITYVNKNVIIYEVDLKGYIIDSFIKKYSVHLDIRKIV